MLFPLRRRSANGPSTEPGERIYVVGDVHGRLDLLTEIVDRIGEHAGRLPPARAIHVVLLGDLVDRGPDSAGVLGHVHSLQRRHDAFVVLKGNHEDMMIRALAGERGVLSAWLGGGGAETLASYGIPLPAEPYDEEEVAAALRAAVPRPIRHWLAALPLTARSGDYFFCHAGVRPGVPLKRQSAQDLLWIRREFLSDDSDHGAVVVHGHSIASDVEWRDNRIGIDTGAYRTGRLTALYLEGTEREIIATG